jgi:hypothetical protein
LITIRKGGEFSVPNVPSVPHVSETPETGDANEDAGMDFASPDDFCVPQNRIWGDAKDAGDDEIHAHSKNDDMRPGRFDYPWEQDL